jgi:hypothetical protein
MPSLEILDIGRNKIKRLPTQPGFLVNLRVRTLPLRHPHTSPNFLRVNFQVFSFYRNKITRLPPYLVKFTHLSILRAEQNPWEWPPKRLMETQSPTKDFIKSVQRWIEDNTRDMSHSALREEPGLEPRRYGPFSVRGDLSLPHSELISRRPDIKKTISTTYQFSIHDPRPSLQQPQQTLRTPSCSRLTYRHTLRCLLLSP